MFSNVLEKQKMCHLGKFTSTMLFLSLIRSLLHTVIPFSISLLAVHVGFFIRLSVYTAVRV